MASKIFKHVRTASLLLVVFTILTGLIYPFVVTCLAQLVFPFQANGSFLEQKYKIVGSRLIGQTFSEPKYFYGRPSATTPFPYNAENSSGSNLGPSNPDFLLAVKNLSLSLRKQDSENHQLIPVDLVTSSGSGLDPEISPMAALYQVHRVAKARGFTDDSVQALVLNSKEGRTLGILGEPRVNVLQLNMALDNLKKTKVKK